MKETTRKPIRKVDVTYKARSVSCASVDHKERLLGMNDAMELLSGKWKVQLIGTLIFRGKLRFKELQREVSGIGAKMLTKELQNLEANLLVTRTVQDTRPITVEYEITDYGLTLRPIIIEITHWGMNHRKEIMRD